MSTFQLKADKLGAISGSLCLVHCVITPFLFIAKSCSVAGCAHSPFWWQFIDYLFIAISFFAIYHATKHTLKFWLKASFWLAWTTLFLSILNESFEIIFHSEALIYIPAIAIILLHLYNHKFCKCVDDDCYINQLH